jgi:hypothetical protein
VDACPQDVFYDYCRVRPKATNPEMSYRDGMRGGRAYCGTIKNKVGHQHPTGGSLVEVTTANVTALRASQVIDITGRKVAS